MVTGMTLGAALVALLIGGLLFGRSSMRVSVPPSAPLPVPAMPPTASTNVQTFFVRGVVKELKADGKTVVIDHEEIPNYMAKMTMPFKVKDTNQLASLGTNDPIHFRLNVAEYEFKGQALAITFIFTRCPIPDFCPRMDFRFSEVTKRMNALPDAPKNYHLISLSFDVDYDTPLVLQNHANRVKAQHGADMSRWTFATGKLIDIDDLTERFGMTFAREPGTVPFNHNLRTVVIDATGKVQKVFVGNEWQADALVSELEKAAKTKP